MRDADGWSLEMYRDLAARADDAAARNAVAVLRLYEQVQRLVGDLERGGWGVANRPRIARKERRQAEALRLAASGASDYRIARMLGVTEKTIRNYLGPRARRALPRKLPESPA